MSRRRIPIGGYGSISYERRSTKDGKAVFRAKTMVRDFDGQKRPVSASGPSRSRARQALLDDINDRFEVPGVVGLEGITANSTVGELADEWLRVAQGRNISARTVQVYTGSVENYVKPYMGHWLVREATTGRCEGVLRRHRESGPGERERDDSALRKHLHQIFDVAVRHDALLYNPMKSVEKVQRKREEVRVLDSIEDVAQILSIITQWENADRPGPYVGRHLRDLTLLLMATGMRPGEALALRWQDIVLDALRPFLQINGTLVQVKGRGTFRQPRPKSQSSIRSVELPPAVVSMLTERRAEQEHNPIDAVFVSREGTWTTYSTMHRRWRSAMAGSAYAWVTFKTFRKQVGTMIAHELGARVAMTQLGHAHEATTEAFYIARQLDAPRTAEFMNEFLRQVSGSDGDPGE